MAQKITYYLIIALILSLGFGQILRLSFFSIPFYLHDFFVLTIIALNYKNLKITKTNLPLKLMFFGIIIGWLRGLTLFPLTSLFLPFLYTLRLMFYFLLGCVIHKTKTKIKPHIFVLSGLTSIFIGLLQYAFLPDMRIFQYLGWDDHLNRLILPHFDPTYSGIFFVLTAIYAFEQKHFFYVILTIPATMLTYARSVWISLIVAVFTKTKPVYFLILFLLLCGLIYMLPNKEGEGNNLLRTYSIYSRLEHDYSLIQKVSWNALSGVGYNNLKLLINNPKTYENHATSTNNSYLEIILTTGIIGFLGAILFIKELYQKFPSRQSFIFVLVASLFNNVLLYPFILLWMIILPLGYYANNAKTKITKTN